MSPSFTISAVPENSSASSQSKRAIAMTDSVLRQTSYRSPLGDSAASDRTRHGSASSRRDGSITATKPLIGARRFRGQDARQVDSSPSQWPDSWQRQSV